MTPPSTALALQDPDDHNRIVVPPALADLGVTVGVKDGVRIIQIPDGLSAKVNIIQPVTQIAQADPDFTPRLNLVKLNVEQHTYKQEGKLALTKEALLLLAHASGVDIDTEMVPRSLLRDSEIAYKAYVTVRRSDGTFATWSETKKTDLEDERAAVEAQVRAQAAKADGEGNPWTPAAIEERIRTRWIKEKPHMEAKCETKAVLRAVAAVLQVSRGGYSAADLSKPFMTIGWGYSPSDPEARRLRAQNAARSLSGRGAPLAALPDPTVETPPLPEYEPDGDRLPPADVVDAVPAAAVPQSREPDPDEPVAGEIPADVAAAGEVVFGEGFRAKGKKVREVRSEYLQHIAFEHDFSADQELVVLACRTWVAWTNSQQVQA